MTEAAVALKVFSDLVMDFIETQGAEMLRSLDRAKQKGTSSLVRTPTDLNGPWEQEREPYIGPGS